MSVEPKYEPSNLDHVEDLEKYEKDGYHPVHLNDKFDKVDGKYRYEVIHKLGHGGFSTVWLAQDLIDGGYVALKIICAFETSYGVPPAVAAILDAHPSKSFVTELRRFFITGPNGRRLCQVLPVTGPSLLALSGSPYRLRPAVCKKLAREAAQALEYLHSNGLCHGDFTPSNLVLTISPALHALPKTTLLTLLGTPIKDPLRAYTPGPNPFAPSYIVQPADLTNLSPTYLTPSLQIIDFDQLFSTTPSPNSKIPTALGTPLTSLAPEVIIDGTPGPASDIWAFGCTLFHMRAGTQLLSEWHYNMPSNVLYDIFEAIVRGEVPERWKKVRVGHGGNGWPVQAGDEEGKEDKDGEVVVCEFVGGEEMGEEGLEERVRGIWDERVEETGKKGKWKGKKRESEIFWVVDKDEVPHWGNVQEGFPHISEEEAAQFADLLRKMFVYDVEKRITAGEMLKHPWLVGDQE